MVNNKAFVISLEFMDWKDWKVFRFDILAAYPIIKLDTIGYRTAGWITCLYMSSLFLNLMLDLSRCLNLYSLRFKDLLLIFMCVAQVSILSR